VHILKLYKICEYELQENNVGEQWLQISREGNENVSIFVNYASLLQMGMIQYKC